MPGQRKKAVHALEADELFHACDASRLGFTTTEELDDQQEIVGQARALQAVRMGASAELGGFNVFVLGPSGTGRHSFVRTYLGEQAKARPAPSDWCYVNNFEMPERPFKLPLPAGRGPKFRDDVRALIEDLRHAVPAAFDGDDYQKQLQVIEEGAREHQSKLFEHLRAEAARHDIRVAQTPAGFTFIPIKDGKAIDPDAFDKLSEDEQSAWRREMEATGKAFQDAMRASSLQARDMRLAVEKLGREVAAFAVDGPIDELVAQYADVPEVIDYLRRLQADATSNISLFRAEVDSEDAPSSLASAMSGLQDGEPDSALRRYRVNVLVTHAIDSGAPVVFEERPGYAHLVGKIDHLARFGALHTDFNLIRAGALHRANGGYLVLDARKVLSEPFAWEALKQAIKSGCVRIESYAEAYSPVSTLTLEPEPIPLSLKVVLIGERRLYYLLQALDPEFSELFKIAADFDDQMVRDADNEMALARLIGTVARRESLRPLTAPAVCRVVEQCARESGDAERLSTRLGYALDVVREAHYWAVARDAKHVEREDVVQAIDARDERHGRVRDRLIEQVMHGTVLIDTEGAQVGQVNGLAVFQVGDYSFGRPSRITARVALGSGKVIDIEREVELGGPLHSKGVLILAGYLNAHYASDQPLSLSASLVFEQSYGGVDGDSASSAELYALLSALADIPIEQSLAVTGSVNQLGEVQAIGGVNEKIEGFFDICQRRGLRAEQGVLIPASNVRHLMLRSDVVQAVHEGKFNVYPVHTIEQGLTLLTGMDAGVRGDDGEFPKGSVNERVRNRLIELGQQRRRFAHEPEAQDKTQ